jgi:hypothetical protein
VLGCLFVFDDNALELWPDDAAWTRSESVKLSTACQGHCLRGIGTGACAPAGLRLERLGGAAGRQPGPL